MALPQQKELFDATAYLAWEAEQPERNEFMAGEVFAMVGVRQAHNVATLNLASHLRSELKGSPARKRYSPFFRRRLWRITASNCSNSFGIKPTGRHNSRKEHVEHNVFIWL